MTKKRVYKKNKNIQGNLNNRANQLNPNNDAYWKSRGHDKKPSDRNNATSKGKEK